MAKIKVHLFNISALFSHTEIVLENMDEKNSFYAINRWDAEPTKHWGAKAHDNLQALRSVPVPCSEYTFEIEADPQKIADEWGKYHDQTKESASILGNNCAVAAQWFLKTFANIPDPSLSNISVNLLALGVMWPSFIPCPVTLPGRIMDNAKFHIGIRDNAAIIREYSYWFLYTKMFLSTLFLAAAIFAITSISAIASFGIAPALVIAASTVVGTTSLCGFFTTYNQVSAKNIVDSKELPSDPKAAYTVV